MKSGEERVREMHRRAAELKKTRDRGLLLASGSLSGLLCAMLLCLILHLQGLSGGYAEELFAASSLLSEDAGGYVLVAVVFFMLGVVISVLLIRYQRKRPEQKDEN